MLEDQKLLEKLIKKIRLTLDSTYFKGCVIVTASALQNKVEDLYEALLKAAFIPERNSDKPFLFAVDHCFALKGKGTILTGNIFSYLFFSLMIYIF